MQSEIKEVGGRFALLQKVTPLSKYLAMTLFIIMPFISTNLSVLDIFNDTYIVLDSISKMDSQSFCSLGMGCFLPIKWLSSRKFEVEIQNISDSSYETRVYQF